MSDTQRNVELWTRTNAEYTAGRARDQWSREDFRWGIWGIPESRIRAFPPLDNMLRVTIGTDADMAKFRDVFWKVYKG